MRSKPPKRHELHFAGYDFDSGPEGTVVHRVHVDRTAAFSPGDRVTYTDVNLPEPGTVTAVDRRSVYVEWDRYPGRPTQEWAPNLRLAPEHHRSNPTALRRTYHGRFVAAGHIPENARDIINAGLVHVGLDGNHRFSKPGHGLTAAADVLAQSGVELASVVGWLSEREERTRTARFDLAWTNPEDAFSPEPISGNELVFMWYWFPTTDRYEVVAYVS